MKMLGPGPAYEQILTFLPLSLSLPGPNVTPTRALACSAVISWQGAMSVGTAVGRAVSDAPAAAWDAGVDGNGVAAGDGSGGQLPVARAGADRRAGAPPPT